MAKLNPQWRHFALGHEVLSIFHGPHAYISPRWYQVEVAVPTWNYAVAHVYGKPTILMDQSKVLEIVRQTVRFYEGNGPDAWRGELPPEYESKMLNGIVGFEIAVTRMEGKFKFGQNRSKEDVASVYSALSQSNDAEDRALAALMKQEGVVSGGQER
jgi:transcriptional regulator